MHIDFQPIQLARILQDQTNAGVQEGQLAQPVFQRLVAVIFNTVNDPLLGPILVIVDLDREAAIGYGLRL